MVEIVRRVRTAVEYKIPARRAAIARAHARDYESAISQAIADPTARTAFDERTELPCRWGIGMSERIVEFPWVVAALSRSDPGLALDAGSTLNHPYVLDSVLPVIRGLHIVTLAPEPRSFPERGISYVFADLRDLPLRSDLYDTVVCLSTLEHVGMDVSGYNGKVPPERDPQAAAIRAVKELRRVLKPGGRVLLSVPYGRADSLGWLRQFDESTLQELLEGFGPAATHIAVYRYTGDGWQLSSLEDSAASESQPYWATAVACVEISPR